ncbi:hypothetical protein AMJ85_09345 [candidate division BRC1 bacterium SM23_51]|nr:MAG: hypothetical protein AMJ85_09345 [candidate division BRC1 bacterium SM23_51]
MKRRERRILAKRKRNLQKRLDRRNFKGAGRPIFSGGSVRYEMADRVRGVGCGGIGAIHTMVQALGLDAALNDALLFLKIHAPYFESDHVLNLAYNILTGGDCLEDIERLRESEAYMDASDAAKSNRGA